LFCLVLVLPVQGIVPHLYDTITEIGYPFFCIFKPYARR
jgi:hypothetical protein